jgi:S-adenosylmethionine/arginine decarboxylase-like enzyme
MADVLGEEMRVLVMVVTGDVSEEAGKGLVNELIEKIGMSVAPENLMCRYPVDGKGGFGYTFFQPLTESFVALDSWPDLGGAYLFICSCGSLPTSTALEIVKQYGLDCKHFRYLKMGLKDASN